MKYYALFYEVADDYLARRPQDRLYSNYMLLTFSTAYVSHGVWYGESVSAADLQTWMGRRNSEAI